MSSSCSIHVLAANVDNLGNNRSLQLGWPTDISISSMQAVQILSSSVQGCSDGNSKHTEMGKGNNDDDNVARRCRMLGNQSGRTTTSVVSDHEEVDRGGCLVWEEVVEEDEEFEEGKKYWGGSLGWRLGQRKRHNNEWSADQVWEVIGDFCGLKRWVPTLDCCLRREIIIPPPQQHVGNHDDHPLQLQKEVLRYCEAGGKRVDGRPERWVLEKLLSVSETERSYTYTMLDGSYGVSGYVATLGVIQQQLHEKEERHCPPIGTVVVVWRYRVAPAPHLFASPSECLTFFSAIFQRMMLSLESSLPSIFTT